jgi:hypothetical protein
MLLGRWGELMLQAVRTVAEMAAIGLKLARNGISTFCIVQSLYYYYYYFITWMTPVSLH